MEKLLFIDKLEAFIDNSSECDREKMLIVLTLILLTPMALLLL